jgi:hypothetical protein
MTFPTAEYRDLLDRLHLTMLQHADIADIRIDEDKWTLKEIVGHLIDSASSNHLRFSRLQLVEKLSSPCSEPEEWMNVSKQTDIDYGFLVDFWRQYNQFLLYCIESLHSSVLSPLGQDQDKSLAGLISDYFQQLQWHLDLFQTRSAEIRG